MQQFTIYFEKLKKINMIYQFALNINIFNLNIFVDNQTTIQTITNSKNYSNQYILRKICIKITKFQNKKIKIRLH